MKISHNSVVLLGDVLEQNVRCLTVSFHVIQCSFHVVETCYPFFFMVFFRVFFLMSSPTSPPKKKKCAQKAKLVGG